MEIETLEKLRSKLIIRRRDLIGGLAKLTHDLHYPVEPPSEFLEKAKAETAILMKTRMGDRRDKELNQIDQALNRIEAGSYGICFICGAPISIKRLEIVPETTLCRRCAKSGTTPIGRGMRKAP
jgi:DnaK suppressor protein